MSSEQVTVKVLKSGRWAQEPWLDQLDVEKGDRVNLSISVAHRFQEKGKCIILSEEDEIISKRKKKVARQIKKKSEKDPAAADKKAAEG